MTAPAPLVTLAAAARHLAKHGIERERSSLLRFLQSRPHLIRGYRDTASKKGPLVNADDILAAYRDDYTRQLHSGEASGLRTEPPAAPQTAATPPADPSAPPPGDDDEDPAKQRLREDVRKRRRENLIAEGQLAPVAEIEAVLADIIPEIRQAFARQRQKHAERLAADIKRPDLAVTISAAFQDFEAAGLNGLADIMAARAGGEDTSAQERFEVLAEMAGQLRQQSA